MDFKSAFYETLIVISPTVSVEEKHKILYNVETCLKREGEILYIINWGTKKLEYFINHKKYGIFYIFYCNLLKNSVKKIAKQITQNENIIRFLIIKITKNYKYYLEERFNIILNKINND
ncbi:30S ribosomal protein S6 [Candidatus Karelsulcia muelleri]